MSDELLAPNGDVETLGSTSFSTRRLVKRRRITTVVVAGSAFVALTIGLHLHRAPSDEDLASPKFFTPVRVDGARQNLLGTSALEDSTYDDYTFNQPEGAAIAPSGDIFVSDTFNNVIKKLDEAGNITLVAGTGLRGYNDDSNPFVTMFSTPTEIAFDDGTLIVLDTENYLIRRISLDKPRIENIAGIPEDPGFPVDGALAKESPIQFATTFSLDRDGSLIVPMTNRETNELRLVRITTDGRFEELPIPDVIRRGEVVGVVADRQGLYLNHIEAETGNRRLVQIDLDGQLLASVDLVDSPGSGLAKIGLGSRLVYGAGTYIGYVDVNTQTTGSFSDGNYAKIAEVISDGDRLLVVDSDKGKLMEIGPNGELIRENGNAASILPKLIIDAAVLDDDHLLLLDNLGGRIFEYEISTRFLSVFAGNGYNAAAVEGNKMETGLQYPSSIAVDSLGNVFVNENHRILRINRAGKLEEYSGTAEAGDVSDVSRGDAAYQSIRRIRFDSLNNLYVADTFNGKIKMISPDGHVSTVLRGLNHPLGIEPVPDGSLLVADSWNNNVIRYDGRTSTPYIGIRDPTTDQGEGADGGDGGPALQARLNTPNLTASTTDGVYVLDSFNNKIRYLDKRSGILTTEFGDGAQGYSSNSFNLPTAIFIHDDYLYVVDAGNSMVSRFNIGTS